MSEVKLSKLRKNARSAQVTFDAALQSALDPTLNDSPASKVERLCLMGRIGMGNPMRFFRTALMRADGGTTYEAI